MKKTTITCDGCGKDLATVNSGYDEYRIHVEAQRISNTSDIRYGIDHPPPISGPMDFCNVACLQDFFGS